MGNSLSRHPSRVFHTIEEIENLVSEDQAPSSCQCCHSKGRNLVLCVDGTANQFGMKNTNVVELYSRLLKDEDQLTYYNSGIGTYAKPSFKSWSYIKQIVDHSIDMAIAWRFESIIHAAYEWLSENYQPGDRIFLFGFSRGAYQVRVIAGMIHRVGLLHKGNKSQIPFAYELYASTTHGARRESPCGEESGDELDASDSGGASSEGSSEVDTHPYQGENEITGEEKPIGDQRTRKSEGNQHSAAGDIQTSDDSGDDASSKLCAQFKRTLCHPDVKVHFVGAWDTVSSIGITRGPSLPETTTGMEHVCTFRHALALDEHRVKFQPEYVNGGLGAPGKNKGNVKEVWFAGSHSDIGGGNIDNGDLNNFGPALRWMTYEAMSHGLRMRPYQGTWAPAEPTESLAGIWVPFEFFPFQRLSYLDNDGTTYLPHLAMPRIVQPGQLIHESVLDLMVQDAPQTDVKSQTMPGDYSLGNTDTSPVVSRYCPSACLGLDGSTTWNSLFEINQLWRSSQGSRYYENSETERLRRLDFINHKHLLALIQSDPFAAASHALRMLRLAGEKALKIIEFPGDNTQNFEDFDNSVNILRTFLDSDSRLATVIEVRDAAKTLLAALEVDYRRGRAMSSQSRTVDVLIPLLSSYPYELPQHERKLKMSQIRDWTLSASEQNRSNINKVLQRFANWILQSKDAGFRARFTRFSTVNDREILICAHSGYMVWDTPADTLTTISEFSGQAHEDSAVNAHATSADGYLIAYGSIDPYAVTIIDTRTGEPTQVIDLDNSQVLSVCFSHNSTLLASGSHKGAVTLWRIETNGIESRQFFGHIGDVNALAFSPDDSLLASACDDRTVRVWDVGGGDVEVIVLKGHEDYALSVSWSPSGDRIASSGANGQIFIWDLKGNVILNLLAHPEEWIWATAFSPDGRSLASGGNDSTLRVWNCETKKQIWCFETDDRVTSVAFSADGLLLVTGEDNGMVRIWDMDTRLPIEEAK